MGIKLAVPSSSPTRPLLSLPKVDLMWDWGVLGLLSPLLLQLLLLAAALGEVAGP